MIETSNDGGGKVDNNLADYTHYQRQEAMRKYKIIEPYIKNSSQFKLLVIISKYPKEQFILG
ncbi:hypothetical protein QA542_00585 [Staphylococcus saprophyticus]|nr:hypothetical protein QA542_00585 [Staphylococcus saprophyticus]